MTADAVERLRAALAEMTRRRDEWRKKAAGHDELRAAVRAGIEQAGERNLSRVFLRGALVESEKSLAEARAENDRLRAERDAAWQAEAEAMRGAVAICKRIRDEKCENDDQAIGALECALAIQDAINAATRQAALAAMDTAKGVA